MCRECLVTVRPERGRTCLETGAFVINYAGCHACKQRSSIKSVGKEVSEDERDNGDYEETVTFHRQLADSSHPAHIHCSAIAPCCSQSLTHLSTSTAALLHTDTCSVCGHAIAEHYYTFTVAHPQPHNPHVVQQDYLMDCVLCGRAADTSHTLNDVAAQRAAHVVTQAHMSHGISSAMSQQQHATMRQLIGRMEIVSAAVHTTGLSTGGHSVDVDEDEWT